MAKKSGPYVELASHLRCETVLVPNYRELSLEEREKIRLFFNSPLWEKVLNNARCERPTLFPEGLATPNGPQISSNRLHQHQGWQLCEIALVKQAVPPQEKRKPMTETYPDAGRIDYTKPETDKKP